MVVRYLCRTIIRVEEDGLHLDGILGSLERRRAAQVNPLARLPVAGDGKPHVSLGGGGVGGEVQPGLLNVEEAVTLAEGTLLLQHAAAVHQGPLHAVRAPGQALKQHKSKLYTVELFKYISMRRSVLLWRQ
jgi:hypothetical protein